MRDKKADIVDVAYYFISVCMFAVGLVGIMVVPGSNANIAIKIIGTAGSFVMLLMACLISYATAEGR